VAGNISISGDSRSEVRPHDDVVTDGEVEMNGGVLTAAERIVGG